jgi:hypothetical protein
MKTNIKRALGVCLAAAISLGMMTSSALGRPTQLIRFHLPQQANVNDVMMPAGDYTVRDMGLRSGVPLLQIRSEDAGVQVTTFADVKLSANLLNAKQSAVTLRYDGSAYRLESIRVAGTNMSYQIPYDAERF